MIRDIEFFHGAALAKLVRSGRRVTIAALKGRSIASYVVNDCCGLYLKHSSSRMSPWAFRFHRDNQQEIDELHGLFGYVVVGLICNDDGIVGLSYAEFRAVLAAADQAEAEGIGISRKPRGMYTIKGREGRMQYRVGEGDFVRKVFAGEG